MRVGVVAAHTDIGFISRWVHALPAPYVATILPPEKQFIFFEHHNTPFDLLHIFGATASELGLKCRDELQLPVLVSVVDDELAYLPDIDYGGQVDVVRGYDVVTALAQMDRVIVPSVVLENQVKMHMPLTHLDRVRVVPFGVDTEHFALPEEDRRRPCEFLYVGRLSPEKDPHTLLQLIATLPNSRLDIVGDGAMKERLEYLAEQTGIADRVYFHGEIDYADLPLFYQHAQFLLVTSRYEAFCMSAIEALACGVGVIGTEVGILPELGATAPVGNVVELQKIILKRMRQQSHEWRWRHRLLVEQEFSLVKMAERTAAIYAELLSDVAN